MTKFARIFLLFSFSILFASWLYSEDEEKFITITDGGKLSAVAVVASLDGKPYVFCPQSSLFGFNKLLLSTSSGDNLTISKLELADDRDLVKITVKENLESFFEINLEVEPSTNLYIANSASSKKVPLKNTRVNAVGLSIFELSIDSNAENYGYPLFDDKNRLSGFCVQMSPKIDFSLTDDRMVLISYSNQCAVRFASAMGWTEIDTSSFYNLTLPLSRAKASLPAYLSVINDWRSNPYGTLNAVEACPPELEKWISAHNKLVKNYPEYLTKIKNDRLPPQTKSDQKADGMKILNPKDKSPNKNAALIQKLQKFMIEDGTRLKTYPAGMAKSLEMQNAKSAFLCQMLNCYSEIYRSLEAGISLRSKFLLYLDPLSFEVQK
ncbi:MAG: hypothetical protein QXH80_05010 [Candidatus Nanoarchaeia archaeon]